MLASKKAVMDPGKVSGVTDSKSVQLFHASCKAYAAAEKLTETLVAIKYDAHPDARAKIEHALNSLYHVQVMINSARNIIARES
jgi:hypothetical protein